MRPIERALELHQKGRLTEAEALYREILAREPVHPEALNLLGILSAQQGDARGAVNLIEQAIAQRPEIAEYHNNLGEAFRALGRFETAIAAYQRALALRPNYPAAYDNLGNALQAQGRLEEAIGAYRQALVLDSSYAQAYNNLGTALQAQGDLAGGIAAYQQAIRLNPEYAQAHSNLGVALEAALRPSEAIPHLRRALALDPVSPEIYYNLGNALRAQGQLDEAIVAYRQALALAPGHAEASNNLGTALEAQGRLSEAAAVYSHILELNPEHVEAHNNLGNVLHKQGELELAISCYQRALAIRPAYVDTLNNLGSVLNSQGRSSEAIAALERAVTLDPSCADLHNNLGNALEAQSKFDEAIAAYHQALAIKSDFPEAYNNLGNVLIDLGQIAAAEKSYREALRHKPDLGIAYNGIVRTRRYSTRDHEDARTMLALLDNPVLPETDVMHLHFALGKVFDDCGAYDEAFAHYSEGNRIKHKSSRFDAGEHTSFTERVIRTFTAEFFSQRSGYGSSTELPVFIVGMPRSGTTLVEQIVASHPHAHGAGELSTLPALTRNLGVRLTSPYSYPEVASALDRDTSRSLAAQYEQALRQGADSAVARITDKMPVNFMHLGLVALLFPNARVIHCLRDPFDVCVSIYFQLFRFGNDYAYDLADIGAYYRQYRRLMAHWRAVLPLRILEIRYEDLVSEQEPNTRRLLEFLGLPWDEQCLAFHNNPRPVQTASAWQVRQPLHKSAVGRSRNYEKFLGPLQRALELDS